MSTKRKMMHSLMAKEIRKEKLDGRDYLVAPTVMITEGVHNGVMYTAEELAKFPESWDGRPVVVHHPHTLDGRPTGASKPKIVKNQTIGQLFNTTWDDDSKKLKSEAWIDIAKAKKIAPDVLKAFEDEEMLEVSTGLFTDDLIENGAWNDEDFEYVATNFRPDHLAVLPGDIGACSIADGAGMPRLNQAESIKLNELSHDELRTAISEKINPPMEAKPVEVAIPYRWIRDVYEDHVILQAEGGKMYKQSYSKDEDDNIVLDGDMEEVVEKKEYVPVANEHNAPSKANSKEGGRTESTGSDSEEESEGESKSVQTNTQKEKDTMDRDRMISALMNNAQWKDSAEFLKGLSDENLKKIHDLSVNEETETQKEEPKTEDTPEVETEETEVEEPKTNAKPVTVDEYIASAPAEMQGTLRRAVARDRQIKSKLVSELKANSRCKFSEQDLNGMELEQLQKLATLAQVEVDYSGRDVTEPKVNADDGAVPAMPALFATK